jgi:PEP-CTERM motif
MKLFRPLFISVLAFAGSAFGASQIELITINTSSLPPGTTGNLDFAFNGGILSQAATASITNFSTNGVLNPAPASTSGTVGGSLPSALSLANNNSDYFRGFTYGTTISFNLQFSGSAVDSPKGSGSGSIFSVSLFNATGDGVFLTSNQNDGWILNFDIDVNGHITSTTYPTETGAPSVVAIQAASVPEPSAWLLLGIGLAALGILMRRRNPKTLEAELEA